MSAEVFEIRRESECSQQVFGATGEATHLGNWLQSAGVGAERIPADLGEWVRVSAKEETRVCGNSVPAARVGTCWELTR